MSIHNSGVITDKNSKQLTAHGTNEFPCAAYEVDYAKESHRAVDLHWHEELEIVYCAQGFMDIRIPSKSFHIEQGEIAIFNTNVMHYIDCSKNCVLQSFVFKERLISGFEDSALSKKYIQPLLQCHSFDCVIFHRKNIHWFKEAFHAIKNETFAYEFIVQKNLGFILLDVYKILEQKIEENTFDKNIDNKRLRSMISYIHENYAQSIDVQSIADIVGISKRECLRCFKKTIQISPMQYLIKYRIMKSAEFLLKNPTTSIVQISLDCGFDSPSYYTQMFKRYYNCTPKEYRNTHL